ncbi:hypothetical protein SCE1572_13470 [Sorangium cellulosum So0157-2]|uniref:Protein kinase domain-containing protein n=1 Tax=Sorangium cellulosum So0157-2 TaxID=1254432 RepID=S4XSX0_SORCE|nr:hypothetical protein SCE1572_13470 [Sorangium cellulosum So0157-2]
MVAEGRRGEAPPAAIGRTGPPLLKPGTWFVRRFRVDRLLGQGGMGAVYAVTEKGQSWALKLVRSEFLDDPDQRRRLLREGEVLARMRHPNVVQVHEVGLTDNLTAWYRMELLDGVTFREELRRRRALSLPLACATVRAAALGAGHLHLFGGIHRDIKPENLFIVRGPRDVKLLDFGLARLSGAPDTLDAQTHGSPLYMAPEQIRDEVPTPATDVYALGLIAYEAIAGFHPFGDARAAGRVDALFAKHLNEVPPPLTRVGVPEEISDVIARAINKVPRERHRDGLAFADALWDAFLAMRDAPSTRDTNPGEPEISEVLRWGNEQAAATTGPAASDRPRASVERAAVPAAAAAGSPGGAATRLLPRDPQAGRQAGGEADPGQHGTGWGMTERLPERLRDPSCVAALAQRAPDPPLEQAAAAWVPVEHTVPLPRRAPVAGDARAGARPPAGGSHASTARAAAPAGPVAARPAAASARGATGARPRARITPRTLAIGLSLGVVVSLLLLDVILRLQSAPAAPSPARAIDAPPPTPASGAPLARAAGPAAIEPPAATGTVEGAGAAAPREAPPADGDAGARQSEGSTAPPTARPRRLPYRRRSRRSPGRRPPRRGRGGGRSSETPSSMTSSWSSGLAGSGVRPGTPRCRRPGSMFMSNPRRIAGQLVGEGSGRRVPAPPWTVTREVYDGHEIVRVRSRAGGGGGARAGAVPREAVAGAHRAHARGGARADVDAPVSGRAARVDPAAAAARREPRDRAGRRARQQGGSRARRSPGIRATPREEGMSRDRKGPPRPLTPEQQALVVGAIDLVRARVAELAPYARPEEREELIAWGYWGAVDAASRFSPARGTRFTTYAYAFIAGEILDCLKRERKVRRLMRAASLAARTFVAETSDRFDVIWDDEATNTGKLADYAMKLVATMVLGIVEAGDSLDDVAIDVEDRRWAIGHVRDVYAALGDADRRLYALYYVDQRPMHEVAAELGVSVSTARRRHDALLDRVTAALVERGVTALPPRG